MKIKAIIHPAEEGDNMDEVINNLQDAIQGWLEVANESQKLDPIAQISEYLFSKIKFVIKTLSLFNLI
ncbi:type II toxin-antitoxin system HicB family antitoxin [Geminocystis sp. CENA526]|uniref:type II toxin-antitoxin system HicB family antitoxin n=1 Tax=Geminocystis sp. CENA526 TaxID=1355871 RepID=UPI003D6DC028